MAYLIPATTDPELKHVAQSPELYGAKFRAACRCGYAGKDASTPSHAYKATQVHADHENARERGETLAPAPAAGGEPQPAAAPSRPPVAPRSASRPTGGGTCRCGCGEAVGGSFRPGHDSKLLSRLQSQVRQGELSKDDALAQLRDMPKLHAKLAGRLMPLASRWT